MPCSPRSRLSVFWPASRLARKDRTLFLRAFRLSWAGVLRAQTFGLFCVEVRGLGRGSSGFSNMGSRSLQEKRFSLRVLCRTPFAVDKKESRRSGTRLGKHWRFAGVPAMVLALIRLINTADLCWTCYLSSGLGGSMPQEELAGRSMPNSQGKFRVRDSEL